MFCTALPVLGETLTLHWQKNAAVFVRVSWLSSTTLSDNTRLRNVPQQGACFVEFMVITGTIRRPLWAVVTECKALEGLRLLYYA